MVIVVAKEALHACFDLKRQLTQPARSVQHTEQQSIFEPQAGKLYTFITLLDLHKVFYGISAENEWR